MVRLGRVGLPLQSVAETQRARNSDRALEYTDLVCQRVVPPPCDSAANQHRPAFVCCAAQSGVGTAQGKTGPCSGRGALSDLPFSMNSEFRQHAAGCGKPAERFPRRTAMRAGAGRRARRAKPGQLPFCSPVGRTFSEFWSCRGRIAWSDTPGRLCSIRWFFRVRILVPANCEC